jgi:hypothetical protein
MAGNEPKTSGREVDPNGSVSAVALNPATVVSPATDLALRLWGSQASADASRLSWSTDSVCVYMIADLVTSSRGRIDEQASGIMAAHFDNAGQALVAARRIQISMLEFLAARKGEPIAAILLYDPCTAPGGLDTDIVRNVLLQAKPGQILLTDAVARPWADLPGFQFRAAPITVSGANGAGVQEFMWTSADELARLRDSTVDRPAPAKNAISMGATMMVGSPIAGAPQSGLGATGDFVFRENRAQTTRHSADSQPAIGPALPAVLQENANNTVLDGLDEQPKRSLFTATKLIVGAVVIILVAAAVEVLYTPAPVKKPLPAAEPNYSEAAPSNPSTNNATPGSPLPPSSAAQPTISPVPSEPPAKTESVISGRMKQLKSALKGSNQTQPSAVDDIGGLSKDDIPVLLSRARSAMGGGRYEDARNAFRKILQLQPDNQEAKDGLHRIDLIRQNDNQ